MAVDWHTLEKVIITKIWMYHFIWIFSTVKETEHIKLTNTTLKTCISFQRNLITIEEWYYQKWVMKHLKYHSVGEDTKVSHIYTFMWLFEKLIFIFYQMLKINCLFISKTLTKFVSGLCNNLLSKMKFYICFLIRWLEWSITQTIIEKNWTCTGHWSHVIINKLYVRYTRKHRKYSVTYLLYVDTTVELNVVLIIKIHCKYHHIFSNTMYIIPLTTFLFQLVC